MITAQSNFVSSYIVKMVLLKSVLLKRFDFNENFVQASCLQLWRLPPPLQPRPGDVSPLHPFSWQSWQSNSFLSSSTLIRPGWGWRLLSDSPVSPRRRGLWRQTFHNHCWTDTFKEGCFQAHLDRSGGGARLRGRGEGGEGGAGGAAGDLVLGHRQEPGQRRDDRSESRSEKIYQCQIV